MRRRGPGAERCQFCRRRSGGTRIEQTGACWDAHTLGGPLANPGPEYLLLVDLLLVAIGAAKPLNYALFRRGTDLSGHGHVNLARKGFRVQLNDDASVLR